MRYQNGRVQVGFVQARQFPKHLLMNTVENGPDFNLTWVLGGVGVRNGLCPEEAHEAIRDQASVVQLWSSNTEHRQAVVGIRQVAHLPGDVAHAARWLPKPVFSFGLFE